MLCQRGVEPISQFQSPARWDSASQMLPALLNWLGWGLLCCLFRLIVVHLWRAVTQGWQGDELTRLTRAQGKWGGRRWEGGFGEGWEVMGARREGTRWGQRAGEGNHPEGFCSVIDFPGNKQPSPSWGEAHIYGDMGWEKWGGEDGLKSAS